MLLAGRAHVATGDLEAAAGMFQKALQTDPSLAEAYDALGQLFVRQNKLDDARQAYDKRSQERPDDVAAHTMVARILYIQGKPAESRARFEKILSIDPRAAVASNNLAYMDAEAGTNLDMALNRAQVAKAALPDDPDINDTLGWVYVKRGLPALAVNPLEQAIQKNASNPLYHYHLGVAHAQAGDKDRARLSLQRRCSSPSRSTARTTRNERSTAWAGSRFVSRRRRIASVAGARPNFMKIAPIVAALKRRPGAFESVLVHTFSTTTKSCHKSFSTSWTFHVPTST